MLIIRATGAFPDGFTNCYADILDFHAPYSHSLQHFVRVLRMILLRGCALGCAHGVQLS